MLQNQRALNHFGGAFAHQHVIGGDVRLAFRAVQNQGMNGLLAHVQFHRRGEAGAAHAGDTAVADVFNQLARGDVGQMLNAQLRIQALVLQPLIEAIGTDHDAQFFQTGGVRYRAIFHGYHGAGGGRMQRYRDKAFRFGNTLAF